MPSGDLALSEGAMIEVTAGGDVSEPIYRFSDESGSSLATLIGSGTKITASTDLETGNGNSVDDLAPGRARRGSRVRRADPACREADRRG